MRQVLLVLLLLLGIIAWVLIPNSDWEKKINGVSLVSPPVEIESKKLLEVKRINPSWVSVIPYGFSRSGEPSVTFDHDRQWWGEKTEGTCQLIKYAKDNGFKVMLKPHVWVMGEGWTGDFKLSNGDDWGKWENDYATYLMNYAKVADSLNVEMLCIGTEYRIPAKERPLFWRNLIRKVRHCYEGKITYAANWDNYMNITWWDEVDYIGIDSYFPLAEGDNPTIDQVREGWKPIVEGLRQFSNKWNKRILFTEYGFQSVNGGAGKHWEVDLDVENFNPEIQFNAYEATFESLWNETWFVGGFLWKWHLTSRGSDYNQTRFTPQGKPAEKVIAKWYQKE